MTPATRAVVLVVHALPPAEVTGTPLVTDGYARELARRGWRVTVVHADPDGGSRWEDIRVDQPHGEPYGRVTVPSFSVPDGAWTVEGFSEPFPGSPGARTRPQVDRTAALERVLRRLDPALVHVVDNVNIPLWVPELAHQMGIPVVRTVSCAEDLCALIAPVVPGSGPAGFCPAPLTVERCAACVWRSGNPAFAAHVPTGDPAADARRRDRLIELLAAKRARASGQFETVYDRIVFASERFRSYFEETLPLDAARVRVIPMGVDFPASGPLARVAEDRGDPLRFVLLSTVDPVKGIEAVVDAFTHPDLSGRDDWRLVLAGGGDRSRFGPLCEDPRVTDHGPYPPDALGKLLAGVDVGLSTSYFETFHRVTREYLLAGLPVIGSQAFGVTDVVVDGVNGVVFDHADPGSLRRAVTGLLDDRDRVAHLGRGAAATRVHAVAEEVDALEALYGELAGQLVRSPAGSNGSNGSGGGVHGPAGTRGGTRARTPVAGVIGAAEAGSVPPVRPEAAKDARVGAVRPGTAPTYPGEDGAAAQPGDGGPAAVAGSDAAVADELLRSLRPSTVFGIGGGAGSLVQALADRGVDAQGREWPPGARSKLQPDTRARCAPEALTAPIPGRYDLVVCFGLAEQLPRSDAGVVLDQVTSASDRVLFAPSPGWAGGQLGDGARAAVRWLRAFADRGFAPVLGHDASYAGPEAMLFERNDSAVSDDLLLGAAALVRWRSEAAVTRVALDRALGDSARLRAEAATERIRSREVEQRFLRIVRELEGEQEAAAAGRRAVEAYESTKLLRYTRRARSLYGRLRAVTAPAPGAGPEAPGPGGPDHYGMWIREFDTMSDERRARLVTRLERLDQRPLVSVLMPVYDPPEHFLRAAIDSVRSQIYENWELCVADDCSSAPWVAPVLEEYERLDPRIRTVRRSTNGHISAASNTALEMARGEWVALLDHDDELSEHALALAVLALADHPDARLLYSDEDKIDESGHRFDPFFKPDFDPLLLLAQNYLCHMTMLRRDLAEEIGGFRVGFEGSQDWDLVLRASERITSGQVAHVPHVIYHWRAHAGSTALAPTEKTYWPVASARAVGEHLERQGRHAEVSVNRALGVLRVRWPLPEDPPKVSIIIPTRDGKYLGRCLESLFARTGYPNFEVVVVDNGSERRETAAVLEAHARWIRVIRDERPFNYSALNNAAVRACSGDVVCLLNDDCVVADYSWLDEMVSQLSQDGVGAVGAKLLYPDDRIQHAGVVLGVGGVAGHAHRLSARDSTGHFSWLFTARTLSAVTAACMVVRRSAFEEVGGFDEEHLGISLNDVDLCLRLGRAGWRVVWTPYAELVHYESISRGHDFEVRPDAHLEERKFMMERWGELLARDPAYNPNLTLNSNGGVELTGEQFALAFPPRAPWWAE